MYINSREVRNEHYLVTVHNTYKDVDTHKTQKRKPEKQYLLKG